MINLYKGENNKSSNSHNSYGRIKFCTDILLISISSNEIG